MKINLPYVDAVGQVERTADFWALSAGTGLIEVVDVSYKKLVETFGLPERRDADKSQLMWVVLTPEGVATIYDYGVSIENLDELRNWHIGGHNTKVAGLIKAALDIA